MSIVNLGVTFFLQILLFILAEKKQMYDQSELEADNPGGSQDFHINSGIETQS